jgi:hypothetical protein
MNVSSDESEDYFDDYDYSYSDEDEDEDEDEDDTGTDDDNDDEHGDEAQLEAAPSHHGTVSMISGGVAGQQRKDAESPDDLLLYEVPEEPEDEDGLTTDDDEDWEPAPVRKRKVKSLELALGVSLIKYTFLRPMMT